VIYGVNHAAVLASSIGIMSTSPTDAVRLATLTAEKLKADS
jgi:hypothetical protein